MSALLRSSGTSETRLPFAVDLAQLQGSSARLWAAAGQAPGVDGVSVRLVPADGNAIAVLDGFKTRALRSVASASEARHLFVTSWRTVEPAGARAAIPERILKVATQRGQAACTALFGLEAALAMVQAESAEARPRAMWFLTTGAQLAERCRNPMHAAVWGLARSARVEAMLPARCLEVSASLVHEHGDEVTLAEPESVVRPTARLVPRLAQAPSAGANAPSAQGAVERHVISGGTGGLGLLTSRWLAQHGADTLVLASRSGTLASGMASEWAQLRATDACTRIERCDTAEVADIRRLLARTPIPSGVWHAAGVLADALLPMQSVSTLARVCAPKMSGAATLHLASGLVPLRASVLFSSIAALLGGSGQANYSAANACLDALAAVSRSCGRVGASVQWGAWAEIGMAARGIASERMAAMEAAAGLGRISLAHGLGALRVATQPWAASVLGVMPVQWGRMLGGGGPVPAFLSDMAPRSQCVRQSATPAVRETAALSLSAVLDLVQRTAGSAVDADAPLMEAGVDSLGAVELRNQLQRAVGDSITLSSTLMFDHPTARQLAQHLQGRAPAAPSAALDGGEAVRARRASSGGMGGAIEVAGVSMSLPASVAGLEALRAMSFCGCDLLSEIPATRWDLGLALSQLGSVAAEVASRVRHGAFMQNTTLFENAFFGISAAEAAAMDPQQRLLLERGYVSLHAAGLSKTALLGSDVGVSVGQWSSEFASVLMTTPAGSSVYAATGFSCSVTCGRVSFVLGLHGPCASFDTACSASLVANHANLRALQRFECKHALSAGVNMMLDPAVMRGNAIAGFTSVKGRSHTFDARADGYARGEAIDTFVCKLADDNEARSTIRTLGSAVRQDGRSASLTAPSGHAQQMVLRAAFMDAELAIEQAAALEAHGTGTALGDPIEAGAVAGALLSVRAGLSDPFMIGSLKANAGHTEPGAGLAGALKLLMQLQVASMGPNAQLRVLNPHVAQVMPKGRTCALPTQACGMSAGSREGGVSSFGYSGTIAHMLLQRSAGVASGTQLPVVQLAFRRRSFTWRESAHPFIQQRIASSQEGVLFRSPLVGAVHALVADHVVQGRVIFPGAGYLELARAASGSSVLQAVFFLQPLALESAGSYIECSVTAAGSFEIRTGSLLEIAVHCTGSFASSGVPAGVSRMSLAALHSHVGSRVVDVGALYDAFDKVGLQYGPGYRTLEQAWGGGHNTATGRLRVRSSHQGTLVHPADLDDAL